jgi:Flp pilus assembly protein TadG
MTVRSSPKTGRSRRRGAAAVETAVCLPVIVLMVFGAIQASSFIFLKQSLRAAAYETARHATKVRSSNADALGEGQALLQSRGIVGARISFNVPDVSAVPRGTTIEIQATASTDRNTPAAGIVLANREINCRVVMVKE